MAEASFQLELAFHVRLNHPGLYEVCCIGTSCYIPGCAAAPPQHDLNRSETECQSCSSTSCTDLLADKTSSKSSEVVKLYDLMGRKKATA